MTDDEFYARCEGILSATHVGEKPNIPYITRWNNRAPGRGRFPDHGIVRLFGDHVQIALRAPVVIQTNIEGRDEALAFLAQAVADAATKETDR